MIDPTQFALFMAGAVALNLTPGPDMTFVMSQGAARGTRAGIAAALGVGAGTLAHIVLAAGGLAAVLSSTPWAFDAIRYVGAAYLVWIAIGLFRLDALAPSAGAVTTAAFRQGALTNVLNPKVALFFLAFLPQFMSEDGGPYWLQSLILGVAFNVSGTAINIGVAVFSGRLAERLQRQPRVAVLLNRLAGVAMCALALKLVTDRRG